MATSRIHPNGRKNKIQDKLRCPGCNRWTLRDDFWGAVACTALNGTVVCGFQVCKRCSSLIDTPASGRIQRNVFAYYAEIVDPIKALSAEYVRTHGGDE